MGVKVDCAREFQEKTDLDESIGFNENYYTFAFMLLVEIVM